VRSGVYLLLIKHGLSLCSRCGRVLSVADFRVDASKAHGLAYHCSGCRDGYERGEFPQVLPETRPRAGTHWKFITDLQWVLERSGLAYCSRGKHILERDRFSPNKQNRHGLESHCKACHGTYAKHPHGNQRGRPRKNLSSSGV
jgi:hypothetical protein